MSALDPVQMASAPPGDEPGHLVIVRLLAAYAEIMRLESHVRIMKADEDAVVDRIREAWNRFREQGESGGSASLDGFVRTLYAADPG